MAPEQTVEVNVLENIRQPGSTLAQQLVRYLLTGCLSAVVTFLVYAFVWRVLSARGVAWDYLLADVIASLFGLWITYTLSCSWVFQNRSQAGRKREFVLFALIGFVGLFWSQLGLLGLVGELKVQRDLAKVLVAAAVFVWNFTVRKMLLFR